MNVQHRGVRARRPRRVDIECGVPVAGGQVGDVFTNPDLIGDNGRPVWRGLRVQRRRNACQHEPQRSNTDRHSRSPFLGREATAVSTRHSASVTRGRPARWQRKRDKRGIGSRTGRDDDVLPAVSRAVGHRIARRTEWRGNAREFAAGLLVEGVRYGSPPPMNTSPTGHQQALGPGVPRRSGSSRLSAADGSGSQGCLRRTAPSRRCRRCSNRSRQGRVGWLDERNRTQPIGRARLRPRGRHRPCFGKPTRHQTRSSCP